MTVIVFKNGFADLIRNGSKVTTIHPPRKRAVKVGDRLSLRIWSGRPYASKQITLIEPWCTGIHDVKITASEIFVDDLPVSTAGMQRLAARDGFGSWTEMLEVFKEMHGLPFVGKMISWDGA